MCTIISNYWTSNCKLAIFLMKPVLATFTVVGPIIWCDNPQVRMSKILYINNNNFHNLGRSQMCAGGCCYFRPSKPHSGTLCAYLAANFLNFPKHPQLFTFWWFWRKVWPKIRKSRNQKICQFEPTLKSSLFSGSNFSTFFSSICPKSTKVKNRPYLTVKRAQKHKENSI